MSEELKNSPIEDFDWEAFEKGDTQGEKSREELEKTYDKSMGSFKDHEVTEGTVISRTASFPTTSSATIPTSRWATP